MDTFGVEEAGLPAVVHHLLLALLRSGHDSSELLRRGAVVELSDVQFEQRGALDRDGGRAVVHQNSPHLFLCEKKKRRACQQLSQPRFINNKHSPSRTCKIFKYGLSCVFSGVFSLTAE